MFIKKFTKVFNLSKKFIPLINYSKQILSDKIILISKMEKDFDCKDKQAKELLKTLGIEESNIPEVPKSNVRNTRY